MGNNVTGSTDLRSRVRLNVPERQLQTTVLSHDVDQAIVKRTTNEKIKKFHEEFAGTDRLLFVKFTLRSGTELVMMLRSRDITIETGRILFRGIIANGSTLTEVTGSLFYENDGWLRLGQVFDGNTITG